MKKALLLVLIAAIVMCSLPVVSLAEDPYELSFSKSADIETIKSLDGKMVTIMGYMATLSPLSGAYMYLMNMPYQSCPFCKPNTTQLSNTMAVYAKAGDKFDFTDQAIRVTGRMDVNDYTDDFGYEYNYRIVDATYEVVDLGTVSEEYALWMSIASDGIVGDINTMFDYLYFLCQWPTYQGSGVDENGNEITYYLYAGDALQLLESDESYGYKKFTQSDYFPSLIKRVKAISETELKDLLSVLVEAQKLEKEARAELDNGNYSYDETTDTFILDKDEYLYNRFYEVYGKFSEWLAKWEL